MDLSGFSKSFRSRFPHLVGRRILVALSGGPDSVALLHLLADPSLELDLHAAHVHHQLRGAEADCDADFCREQAALLGVRFHLRRLTPPTSPPEGREAAWRRLRYQALREVAAEIDAAAVATGHQRDDVAEGVLVQILRGAGPRALAGIASETPSHIIRPLLLWNREELLSWLQARGIPWRSDSSNLDLNHLRNVVRHRALPFLEEIAPALRHHLVHLAEVIAADEDCLADSLRDLDLWIDPWEPDGGIPVERISNLHPALRTRWLHAQAARAGIGRATRRQTEIFSAIIEGAGPSSVTLAGRWRLRTARGSLWLEPPEPLGPYRMELQPDETLRLPIPGWEVRLTTGSASRDSRVRWRRPAPPREPLIVRSPHPEDVVPTDRGPRRLVKLLARRLPRHLRVAWPVLCAGATISWVPGVWDSVPEPEREPRAAMVEVLRR